MDPKTGKELYITHKERWVDSFLRSDFVIFPCHLDKSPMVRVWNKFTMGDAMMFY